MKYIVVLIALAAPLKAELLARFQTTMGEVEVALQYDKAPQTVANFITLAQGTRSRVNPLTGAVVRSPLYVGEKFFRVLDGLNGNADFKIAQTGSGTGNNSGGPGYTFRDEFHASLTHSPYVLSMANSGPATNGSQIFFTGSAPIPGLNNVHTVFGLVTDPASRGVIDAIIAAGDNATTITEISFSSTDSLAIAFDEHAQNLPVCAGVAGNLMVTRGVKTEYVLPSPVPAASSVLAFRSTDLQTWTKLGEIHQGTGMTGFDTLTLDGAALPSAFYQIPLVTYPDALAPASLANRILTVSMGTTRTFTFHFDATGTSGWATDTDFPGEQTTITGVTYSPAPHKATWVIYTTDYAPLRFKGLLKTQDETLIIGTNSSEYSNGLYWVPISSGTLSLTQPAGG